MCMEVQPHSQPSFIDIEERSEPTTEEGHLPRIAIGEIHQSVALGSLPGVERDTRDQQVALREFPDT